MNHGMVMTKTTFSVSDQVFGSTGSEITVLTPGGVHPNTKYPIAQNFVGTPSFAHGQDVMLVLNAIPDSDAYGIAGLSEGVVSIVNNGGQRQVRMGGDNNMVPLREAMQRIRSLRNAPATIELK